MISSRTLLLLLIVLNLLAFAAWSGSLGVFSDSRREPQRLERQIEPDRIRLLTREELGASQSAVVVVDAAGGLTALTNTTGTVTAATENTEPTAPEAGGEPVAVARADTRAANGAGSVDAAHTNAVHDDAAHTNAVNTDVALADATRSDNDHAAMSATDSLSQAGLPGLEAAARQIARAAPTAPIVDPLSQTTALDPAEGAASALPTLVKSPDVTAPVADATCLALPEMDFVAARRWRERLISSGIAATMRRLDAGRYLLFVEPLATAAQASTREHAIRAHGVDTARVIGQGVFRNGIALASVASADEADRLREQFLALGVTDISIGPTAVAGARYRLQLQGSVDRLATQVRPVAERAQLALAVCAP